MEHINKYKMWNNTGPGAKNSNLTHWGQVTRICVADLTITGSDNGLSPGRHQAIIRTNAGISSIGPLGTNFSEILIETLTFSSKKMCFKMSSAKWRSFCLNVLTNSCFNASLCLIDSSFIYNEMLILFLQKIYQGSLTISWQFSPLATITYGLCVQLPKYVWKLHN